MTTSQRYLQTDKDIPDEVWVDVMVSVLATARDQTITSVSSAMPSQPLATVDLIGDALFESSLIHPLALACNRRVQWGALDQLMNDSTRDDLVLVPGDLTKGHTYFLQRIGKCLRRDPSRQIVSVWWDRAPFPICEEEYHEQLAAALRCLPTALHAQLQRILQHHNLVLLHRTVSDRLSSDALELKRSLVLFREWLPKLVREARKGSIGQKRATQHAVKCVQPIAWRPVSRLKEWLARALALPLGQLPLGLDNWLHQHRAKTFLHALEQSAGEFAVQRLDELTDISDEDLRDLCKQASVPSILWPRFINDARRLGSTPEKLLLCLSNLLRDPALKATS